MLLPADLQERVLADTRDRAAWLAARGRRIGASDAAGYARLESWPLYVRQKLHNPFSGNAYTTHGNAREASMLAAYHIEQNTLMFRHPTIDDFVATPDGIVLPGETGGLVLAQAKTTNKIWRTIPRGYMRQVWWEQFVLGAERTLFVWETHANFRPISMEPESCWIDRDEDEIAKLVAIASLVIAGLKSGDEFMAEMEANTHEQ